MDMAEEKRMRKIESHFRTASGAGIMVENDMISIAARLNS